MPDEKIYSSGNSGELKFDFISEKNADDDLKFVLSVKNLLVLIKDFHGADSSAVYWFNKLKSSFKLLTSSEDEQWSNYADRFSAGSDALSKSCLKNSAELYDIIGEPSNNVFPCFKIASKVKSVIVNPLEINGEVIAFIICESKSGNFFGNPNLYSLEVFSESIINLINYYSLKEEYDYRGRILKKLLSSRKVFDEEIEDLYSGEFFEHRISAEINRCNQFNTKELIVIYTTIDNSGSFKESGYSLNEIIKLYFYELTRLLNGYDMIFRMGENLLGIIIQSDKFDNVLIELEKIRKSISTNIFKLEGKEINFTVSFAFKKYETTDLKKEDYLKEIENMLNAATNEGGNIVKY